MNVKRERLTDVASNLLSCVDALLEILRKDDEDDEGEVVDILHFAQPFIPFAEPVSA